MGLDTTHECFHGPYSSFMEWRAHLHRALGNGEPTDESLEKAWKDGVYADQSVPINVLMNHSDCDGEIPWQVCSDIADKLQGLLHAMPDYEPHAISLYGRTISFIAGLRNAAAMRENVVFA